ncbi:MAG: amidase [Bradyrhizobium sp.]|uniref:amidase n=1 Tax=Bradyrhizobium sp. TaxID=376 RepID=UPI00121AAE64|nr:amidase [Bradyrhizobium sp.]THD60057.1 MAG: amidase [Bradyrhizobium sp.]
MAPQEKTAGFDCPKSIFEASNRLSEGSLSVEALTRHYLAGIDRLQPSLNAFITITKEEALRTASRLDEELRSNRRRGPLHGIPIVYKDNFDTAGVTTTVGSEIFRNRVPTENAAAVERLSRAGVVMLGKTNMNEFAAGPSGTNQAFGDIHNPWDLDRSPGGTSSGTASAVSAGLCVAGTGTDTGGSIRIPASWTGVSGIRPTSGRVSMTGIFPRATSLDCCGPIARSVADLALLLSAMISADARDPRSVNSPVEDPADGLATELGGVRLGIIRDYTFRDIDPMVGKAIADSISVFESLGAVVKTVQIPLLGNKLDYRSVFNILLFEFNQVIRSTYNSTLNRETVFGPVVQSDLRRSAQISTDAYHEAIDARTKQTDEVRAVFSEVDALITPTMATTAPLLSTSLEEFDRGRQFMLPFNFVGLPSLTIPCGFSDGLPIGLQLVCDSMNEALLLRIGHAFQSATDHHKAEPPLYWNG